MKAIADETKKLIFFVLVREIQYLALLANVGMVKSRVGSRECMLTSQT